MKRLRGGGLMPAAPVLPVSGGFGEQPALVMDAFELFDHWAESRRASADGPA